VRVVVDTNVFVSGLINPRGAPGAIVDAVIEGRITPVFSSETLAELQDVLARPRLQRFLTRAAIRPEALLARLALIARVARVSSLTGVWRFRQSGRRSRVDADQFDPAWV
jgi:putative PIN family toxin of toxin-antitoxin system